MVVEQRWKRFASINLIQRNSTGEVMLLMLILVLLIKDFICCYTKRLQNLGIFGSGA